jgi:hypothetical protein
MCRALQRQFVATAGNLTFVKKSLFASIPITSALREVTGVIPNDLSIPKEDETGKEA